MSGREYTALDRDYCAVILEPSLRDVIMVLMNEPVFSFSKCEKWNNE